MKIGVQTGGIVDRFGIEKGFRMIREAGFEAIDLNLDHLLRPQDIRGGKLEGFFQLPEEEQIKKLTPYRDAIRENGLDVYQAHALFPCLMNDAATDAYLLEGVRRTIHLAKWFGCMNLVVHPGIILYENRAYPLQVRDANMAMYKALIPDLLETGVTVCLENLFYRVGGKIMNGTCSEPGEAVSYVDELNQAAGRECFGFCLDTGHALLVGHDPRDMLLPLGKRIRCFHVHDNDGRDDEHLLPFMGVSNWDGFVQGVRAIGFDATMCFETFRAMETFPEELGEDMLRLAARTARYLADRIEA